MLPVSASANVTGDVMMLGTMSKTPDCEWLGHPAEEDPRWVYETASSAKCECYSHFLLKHCTVVIPNDHIFDEDNIAQSPQLCGRSVYEAVSRWKSAKSGHSCELDAVRSAPLPCSPPPHSTLGTQILVVREFRGVPRPLCES